MDLELLNPTLFSSYQQAKAYPPDEFGGRWNSVSAADVEKFEAETKFRLPKDYVDFITTYGTFTIWTDGFERLFAKAAFTSGKTTHAEIGTIAGPLAMLEWRKTYLSDDRGPRIPADCAPLTFDSSYGHAMIVLSEQDYGKILYLKVKAKPFGSIGYGWDLVATIAGNFHDFISGIGAKKTLARPVIRRPQTG